MESESLLKQTLIGKHSREVRCLCADERYVYSGSFDNKICKWNPETNKLCWTIETDSYIFALRVYDHFLYAVGSFFRAYNKKNRKIRFEFEKNKSYIYDFDFYQNKVYRGGSDNCIREFDTESGKELRSKNTKFTIWSLRIFQDKLYTGCSNQRIEEYDIENLDLIRHFDCSTGIWGFNIYNNHLYFTESGKLIKYSLEANKRVKEFEFKNYLISNFQIDDIWFIGGESGVIAWDLSKDEQKYLFPGATAWGACGNKKRLFIGLTNTEIYTCDISQFFYYTSLLKDLKKLYKRKESCDITFKTFGGEISVHKLIISSRIGKDYEKVLEYFQSQKIEEANIFFRWIYTGISQDDQLINQILEDLKIGSFKELNGIEKVSKALEKLYKEEETKDFTILIGNKSIKAHKVILMARSDLYRGMFLNVDDKSNQVNDYSGKSFKTLQLLIEFIYTDKLNTSLLSDQVISELEDAVDYYQLNTSSILPTLIDEFKKNKKKKK
ncbi:hypothetical protein M0811_02127 [Anaeramoeba ignava]|uniref:BTB domain-containing protein n=1 Tax=Anaeramoeba ignava TaxID=1746090 RepID=A0A9Q0LB03_ANAIG|nr:hypothetical protein M0811_02127 [Anaeramoeba ignava]